MKVHNHLQSTIIETDQDYMQTGSESKFTTNKKELYILEGKKKSNKKKCSMINCNGKGNLNQKNKTHRRLINEKKNYLE